MSQQKEEKQNWPAKNQKHSPAIYGQNKIAKHAFFLFWFSIKKYYIILIFLKHITLFFYNVNMALT